MDGMCLGDLQARPGLCGTRGRGRGALSSSPVQGHPLNPADTGAEALNRTCDPQIEKKGASLTRYPAAGRSLTSEPPILFASSSSRFALRSPDPRQREQRVEQRSQELTPQPEKVLIWQKAQGTKPAPGEGGAEGAAGPSGPSALRVRGCGWPLPPPTHPAGTCSGHTPSPSSQHRAIHQEPATASCWLSHQIKKSSHLYIQTPPFPATILISQAQPHSVPTTKARGWGDGSFKNSLLERWCTCIFLYTFIKYT